MKTYKQGYDYLFLPDKNFHHQSDYIGSMAVYVTIEVAVDGETVTFETNSDVMEEQKVDCPNGDSIYLVDLIQCFFHKDKVYDFAVNIPLFRESGFSSIQWTVIGYAKDIVKNKYFVEAVYIEEKEFMDIMRNHLALFDNSDNYPTQNTSFFSEEIKGVN